MRRIIICLLIFLIPAMYGAHAFGESSDWTHDKIVHKLSKETEYDPGNVERKFIDIETDSELQIRDRKLFLKGQYILDVSGYYEADIDNKEKPLLVRGTVYSLSETKLLYCINVLQNRNTGGRDPGVNLYYLEDSFESEQNSELEIDEQKLEELKLGELYNISYVFADEAGTVWISGYKRYWKNKVIENVYTLTPENDLINWADVLRRENRLTEDVTVFAQLVEGEEGFYVWFWANSDQSSPWLNRAFLNDGVVYKLNLDVDGPSVERIASTSDKEVHYGMKDASDYSFFPSNVLITSNNQVYYKTDLPGYIHLNSNSYILFESVDTLNGNEVGDVIGIYNRTNLILEQFGDIVDIYIVDGEYAILSEDLRFLGVGMFYDSEARLTRFSGQNEDREFDEKNGRFIYNAKPAELPKSGDIIASDIKLYLGSEIVKGYNVGGYSLIKLKDYIGDFGYTENDVTIRDKQTGVRHGLSGSISGQIINNYNDEISGEIIVYGTNEAAYFSAYVDGDMLDGYRINSIEPLIEQPFSMNTVERSVGFHFSEETVRGLPLYNTYFVGYKIDPEVNGAEKYILDSNENKGNLIYLSQFEREHNDLSIELNQKKNVRALFKMPDPIYYVDGALDRKLIVEVLKLENGFLQDEKKIVKSFDQSVQEIALDLELDENGEYEMRYQLLLYDDGSDRYRNYDEGFLYASDDGLNQQWVDISKYTSNFGESSYIEMKDVVVQIDPTYKVAFGYKTDIEVLFDGVNIDAINMDGLMMANVDTLSALGMEVVADATENIVSADSSGETNYVKTSNLQNSDNYQIGDYLGVAAYLTVWSLNIGDVEIPLFMINGKLSFNIEELQKAGYAVKFNDESRMLNVLSPE